MIPPLPPALASLERKEAENLLRCLGYTLNSLSIFGEKHKATQRALDAGFAALCQIVARQPGVTLGADKGRLVCDAHSIEPTTAMLRTLLRRWSTLALGSLELTRGVTRDEFRRLLVLLGTATDEAAAKKAFPGKAGQGGFEHLHLSHMSYQAVSEDDVVVKKQAMAQKAGSAPRKKPSRATTLGSEIIAYLQSPSGGPLASSPEAAALAAHPSKLAELLLRSADIRPETAQVAGGEQLGNLVVGCLRRLHGHLTAAPAAKTKQGKKAIRHSLVMLEKAVVEQLRNMVGVSLAAEAAPVIEEAVSEMVGDVRMDDIVEDYVQKRQQTDASEKRLVRLIKAQQAHPERAAGLGKLQQKLTASGLTGSDWEALLQKSTTGGGKAGGASGTAPPLTLLLLRLTELLVPTQPLQNAALLQAQLAPLVSQLGTGMGTAMAGVEQKLGTLREKMKALIPLPDTAAPLEIQEQALSRRTILAILAEIVQELRQPLTVISGAIETLSGGHLGAMPALQREMLNLALQSSRRVAVIVDALADIAGSPATLHPDAQILKHIYET
jgi:signal transduction histidine kinase